MEKRTGIVVPLGAIYTKESQSIGDFLSLKTFADFCAESGLSIIQLLPVNDTGTQSSPYSGLSAFALHPMYIRIEALPEFKEAHKSSRAFSQAYKAFKEKYTYSSRYNYDELSQDKNELLHLIYSYIEKKLVAEEKKSSSANGGVKVVSAEGEMSFSDRFKNETSRFIRENPWIQSYAVYKNLKDSAMQASWKEWSENLQNLSQEQITLRWNNRALKSTHNFFVWCQLRAAQQFSEAAEYCRQKGIILKGDIPILMNEDSCDAWALRNYFSHEERAGSPPDGENPYGQNWGFPTYNWENLALDDYSWWKNRITSCAKYYDAFRIDHILGFFRIWACSARDTTAYLGHTIPFESIERKVLLEKGFNDDRIKWLSKSHIPTSFIENITWNHDEATAILEKVCTRVNDEELWTFNEEIKGDGDFYKISFCEDENRNNSIRNALSAKWRDKALLEITPDHFVNVYKYYESTAWATLSDEEKRCLESLFDQCHKKENDLWKKQAMNVLSPITGASGMVPCAEDLGVNLSVLPEVLERLSIMSLRVIRWSRNWNENGQPYVPFNSYPELSVATTSVHDSSTLRQWWNEEKYSVEAYISEASRNDHGTLFNSGISKDMEFNPDVAKFCFETSAKCNSAWFINPLQDYLFLEQKYYKENPLEERINVPGSVNSFNWTYRMPVSVEELLKDSSLISKIKAVSEIHNK